MCFVISLNSQMAINSNCSTYPVLFGVFDVEKRPSLVGCSALYETLENHSKRVVRDGAFSPKDRRKRCTGSDDIKPD